MGFVRSYQLITPYFRPGDDLCAVMQDADGAVSPREAFMRHAQLLADSGRVFKLLALCTERFAIDIKEANAGWIGLEMTEEGADFLKKNGINLELEDILDAEEEDDDEFNKHMFMDMYPFNDNDTDDEDVPSINVTTMDMNDPEWWSDNE